MKRFNLGCGMNKMEGFINVDDNPICEPDICGKVQYMDCQPESVDRIVASHVLEHLEVPEAYMIVQRFYSWLTKGGVLFVSVPDTGKICRYIADGHEDEILFLWLYGSGRNDEMSHRWGYTDKTIRKVLQDAGFNQINACEPEGGDSEFRYHGDLLSINLECIK